MYCLNCGANVPGDSKFCQGCGSRQDPWSAPFPYLPKQTKMIFLGCIGVYILCVLLVIFSMIFTPTIRMDKYLLVHTEGYDGYGHAVAEIDMDRFAKDYGKRLIDRRTKEDPYMAAERFVRDCVDLVITTNSILDMEVAEDEVYDGYTSADSDRTNKLSNGDVFIVTITSNEQYSAETYGYKVKISEQSFTTEGLQEPQLFDPFEGLDVVFEGISPYGEAYMSGEPKYNDINNFYYTLNQYYDLENGMTVTLGFDEYDHDYITNYFIETYGLCPSAFSKEFTVSGLDWYVNNLEQIPAEAVDAVTAKALELFSNYLDSSDAGQAMQAFNYCGAYLLSEQENSWPHNKVFFVYQAQIQHDYPVVTEEDAANAENAEPTEGEEPVESEASFSQLTNIYWYISYEDLLTNDNGELLFDIEYYNTPSNWLYVDSGISTGWWSTKEWSYRGYESLDQLFADSVEYYVGDYELISSVVDPAAG